jgi:hypothetical protein
MSLQIASSSRSSGEVEVDCAVLLETLVGYFSDRIKAVHGAAVSTSKVSVNRGVSQQKPARGGPSIEWVVLTLVNRLRYLATDMGVIGWGSRLPETLLALLGECLSATRSCIEEVGRDPVSASDSEGAIWRQLQKCVSSYSADLSFAKTRNCCCCGLP